MLTGKHPFEELSKEELVERFSSGVPVDMSAAYARDAGLASLIESMLRFDVSRSSLSAIEYLV